MNFHHNTYAPHPALSPYIKQYWVIESSPSEKAFPVFGAVPYGHPELIFHYGDRFRIRYGAAGEAKLMDRGLIGGQLTQPITLEPTGRVGAFAVRFHPVGFYTLMGHPMHELTDRSLGWTTVFGSRMAGLENQVLEARSAEERILIVEGFFLDRLAKQLSPTVYAHHAVHYIRRAGGRVTVADVCQRMGIGERQLEREFKEKVGLSPKFFIRITRLDSIFNLIRNHPNLSWAGLAYEGGYADQAHLVKEFRSLTGTSPARFFSNRSVFVDVYQGN